MKIRYPRPLVRGDVIGVTSPSSGVPKPLVGRLHFAVQQLRERGFEVDMGDCLDGSTHISAPVEQRAGELMRMLLDPKIKAVVPPWGGATAIDLIPHLDFDALKLAEPTWFVGYSDISTLLTPITLKAGLATLHGSNLMDTPYRVPESLMSWIDIASLPSGARFRQTSPGVHRVNDWDDWENEPEVAYQAWNGNGGWERLDKGQEDVDVTGHLIGGCIETLANLAGTPHLNTKALWEDPGDSLIVYVEASGVEATTICRHLHGMRLAGFFDGAKAILVGRTGAPDSPALTQSEAVLDALGMLGIPIIGNVECGHVPPQLPIVNGAQGHLVFNENDQYLEQTLA
ncbi:S66 peptidase family protein [Arthrobacter sp. H35-D1]|uniref:S66 family peptidase n=1 Tax=Arthrobacter sp. H35-D1 TaxID=3046202 RepID=UPI0024BA7E24|nr:S66 peptidase family protein [Arthrobacter sp. H35-D1]MDJ0315013.1 LD-carboxypeptidase [Arthrobacter sp. H35-D1]